MECVFGHVTVTTRWTVFHGPYLVLLPLDGALQVVQLVLQLPNEVCLSLHLLELRLLLALQQGTLHLCLEDRTRRGEFSGLCTALGSRVIFHWKPPYLLFRLPELLVQLGQTGFELIDASERTDPLLLQVTQLQISCPASTGVLVLQTESRGGEKETKTAGHTFLLLSY